MLLPRGWKGATDFDIANLESRFDDFLHFVRSVNGSPLRDNLLQAIRIGLEEGITDSRGRLDFHWLSINPPMASLAPRSEMAIMALIREENRSTRPPSTHPPIDVTDIEIAECSDNDHRVRRMADLHMGEMAELIIWRFDRHIRRGGEVSVPPTQQINIEKTDQISGPRRMAIAAIITLISRRNIFTRLSPPWIISNMEGLVRARRAMRRGLEILRRMLISGRIEGATMEGVNCVLRLGSTWCPLRKHPNIPE